MTISRTAPHWRASLGVALAATTLMTVAPVQAADAPNSGFLPDYTLLQPVKVEKGTYKRWMSPDLTHENYHAVLVEPVTYYPNPKPTDQVSQETLDQVQDFLTQQLRDVVLAGVEQTQTAGPGVIRMQVAITAVSTGNEPLKVYQLIPIALVFSAAQRATGHATQDVTLSVESMLRDSETGKLLMEAVRQGQGEQLKNASTPVTLDTLKGRIEDWAQSAGQLTSELLGAHQN
jgi:hypothetical protein